MTSRYLVLILIFTLILGSNRVMAQEGGIYSIRGGIVEAGGSMIYVTNGQITYTHVYEISADEDTYSIYFQFEFNLVISGSEVAFISINFNNSIFFPGTGYGWGNLERDGPTESVVKFWSSRVDDGYKQTFKRISTTGDPLSIGLRTNFGMDTNQTLSPFEFSIYIGIEHGDDITQELIGQYRHSQIVYSEETYNSDDASFPSPFLPVIVTLVCLVILLKQPFNNNLLYS